MAASRTVLMYGLENVFLNPLYVVTKKNLGIDQILSFDPFNESFIIYLISVYGVS